MKLHHGPIIQNKIASYTIPNWLLKHYEDLLTIRTLPQYEMVDDRTIKFPAKYFDSSLDYVHLPLPMTDWLFDYQAMLVKVAWLKRKYAYFLDPGLGKTYAMAELARQYHATSTDKIVFCTELNPLRQLYDMCHEIPDFPQSIYLYDNKEMSFHEWLYYDNVPRIGFINHDYFIRYDQNMSDKVGIFNLDESSCLRGGSGGSGKIAKNLIKSTKGIDIKIASSGTPAPNDSSEYAMHALWLELVTSENEFLQQYFVKRDNRWTLKRNGAEPMYKDLSAWSFFMRNPKSYGFDDNLKELPEIDEIYHFVESTPEQVEVIHSKFGGKHNLLPGIAIKPATMTQRTKFSQVSKGFYYDENSKTIYVNSNKPSEIIKIIEDEYPNQILIRVVYDAEGDILEKALIEAGYDNGLHITAKTKIPDRLDGIYKFANGDMHWLMGKAEVLGKGLNLQKYCHIFIVSGQTDCYDKETEVLTKRGWLKFDLLNLDDEIATVNQTSLTFDWQKPTKIIWEHYSGPMIHFVGRDSFDLLVTPNHKLFTRICPIRFTSKDNDFDLRYAMDILSTYKRQKYRMLSIPKEYEGDNSVAHVKLPQIGNSPNLKKITEIEIYDFLELAGWYLSEGYCRPEGSVEFGRITISQSTDNQKRQEIINLIHRIGLTCNSKTKDIHFYSVRLAKLLLDEFGNNSHDKRIPTWIKNLKKDKLILLRDTMLKGDGSKGGSDRAAQRNVFLYYRTVSKRLADDFQEICLKTGIKGSIKIRKQNGYSDIYDIGLSHIQLEPSIWHKPDIIDYDDMIGCVTVPNHTVIVRRNGKPIVSGNSFEDDYQFKKRLHRIGQFQTVKLYRVYTQYEQVILDNVHRKSQQMKKDFEMQEFLYHQSIYQELEEYLAKGDFSYMTTEQIKHAPIKTKDYEIFNANSIRMMLDEQLEPDSIDFSIFSEPFMSDRFTYSKDIGDMGNTKGAGAIGGLHEFMMMRKFFLKGLLTVTKPGRMAAMHVEQVPLIKGVDGSNGYFDYRGWAIETARQIGWIPWDEIPIIKNQQAQAAVKHVSTLAMSNMWKDRTKIASCLNGYLLVFKKPGDNETPITNIFRCDNCGWEGVYDECALTVFSPDTPNRNGQLPNTNINRNRPGCPVCGNTEMQSDLNFDRWVRDAMGIWLENESDGQEKQYSRLKNEEVVETITKDYARKLHKALGDFLAGQYDDDFMTLIKAWYDIRETDILPGMHSQDKDALMEDKHLCPLPINIARRAIRLWSNEGDTVLSPFMGSGTEGVVSLELNRKFKGIELKPEYFMMAYNNLEKAMLEKQQLVMPGWEVLVK